MPLRPAATAAAACCLPAAAAGYTDTERESLDSYSSLSPALSDCLEVLTAAAYRKEPKPEVVEGALLWLEANAAQRPAGASLATASGAQLLQWFMA